MSRQLLLASAVMSLLSGGALDTAKGQQAQPADSGKAKALLALRDSVQQVRLSLNAFQRDLPLVGSETVVVRATELNRRCRRLVDVIQAFRPTVRDAPPRAREAATALADVLDRLQQGLAEHCVQGLAPEGAGSRADTLRAWGPHRVARIHRLISEYERAARPYARSMGIMLDPSAAGG